MGHYQLWGKHTHCTLRETNSACPRSHSKSYATCKSMSLADQIPKPRGNRLENRSRVALVFSARQTDLGSLGRFTARGGILQLSVLFVLLLYCECVCVCARPRPSENSYHMFDTPSRQDKGHFFSLSPVLPSLHRLVPTPAVLSHLCVHSWH